MGKKFIIANTTEGTYNLSNPIALENFEEIANDGYVKTGGDTMTGSLTATSFIKLNGLVTEFLKADGSVDNSTYITGINNITEIPNRDYADITGKPTLNLSNWDTAYGWGDFRDFGLGVSTPQGVAIAGGNLNSTTLANGFYKITPSTVNSPVGGEAGSVIVERTGVDDFITQKAQITNVGDIVRMYVRHYKPALGTWTPWRRVWTTEDFTTASVGNWNAAYNWGNHGTVGYLTSENDPVFSASPAGTITEQHKTNWSTAFGWGNHTDGGYLTPTTGDAAYVKKSGDTMTGNLSFSSTKALLIAANANAFQYAVDSRYNMKFNVSSSRLDVNGGVGLMWYIHVETGDMWAKRNITAANSIIGTSIIKTGGLSTEFLKADGSVDSSTYITGITVTDDNTSVTRNQIATVEGTPLFETVGEILVPELTGNILNIKYRDGDGVIQSQPVDLSTLTTNDTSLSNATYNAATNVITLDVDGTLYTIDLSEFSLLVATDAGGITTVTQEGVIKLTVSKVGQSGQYIDLLGIPTEFNPSAHTHTFSSLTSKPTTLSGYGITDAMSTSHAANIITSTNITNWNTAFGWGDHSLVGYLTENQPHNHDAENDVRYVNLTGDTMTGELTINNQLKINTGNATGLVADTVITTLPVATNEAAFFDYVIKREDALGLRAGTVMAVWDGTNVQFNDTSTKDLGGITDLIDLSVDILTGDVRLVATITGGTWTVKVGTRTL